MTTMISPSLFRRGRDPNSMQSIGPPAPVDLPILSSTDARAFASPGRAAGHPRRLTKHELLAL